MGRWINACYQVTLSMSTLSPVCKCDNSKPFTCIWLFLCVRKLQQKTQLWVNGFFFFQFCFENFSPTILERCLYFVPSIYILEHSKLGFWLYDANPGCQRYLLNPASVMSDKLAWLLSQIQPLFEKVESKNKLLRSVAGGGVEQIGQLQARWDKFELMMESHELMVKEQVSSSWKWPDSRTWFCPKC